MASLENVQLIERDDAGNITSTFIESASSDRTARIDTVLPAVSKSYTQQILDIFLPAGYPQSVTDDYIQYVRLFHLWQDSLQAFSSSIAGMLSSRAVLQVCNINWNEVISEAATVVLGVGVGDASASPTAALLLNVLQESMGRIATILFAHKLGTSLEPECKMYRLAADILNDTAMVLDCLSPAFPKAARVMILSFSSVLRSLCGVCAGSSKASLSAHFAKRGNLGELNAKDSSQETVISLLGMLAGSVVVSHISTPMATWSTLIALLAIHLATNYAAVKSVSMCSLNRQRANIVLSNILETGRTLTPTHVSQKERIFERDGVLRWADDRVIGHCSIGVPMQTLLCRVGLRQKQTGSVDLQAIKLSDLLRIYRNQAFVLWTSPAGTVIVLKHGCTPIDQLKAWTQALLLAQRARVRPSDRMTENDTASDPLADLKSTLNETGKIVDAHEARLRDAGWDLNAAVLETRAGKRIEVQTKKDL
ncbi:DUF647-domain-containing protein [Byssothecium circinans]|uniref:DUF647-domain-containing protein n=1 Tax=Byssothecium circinans TaxID=147558 RepID=A0A6A5UBD9_9PLEO|nr:DUF647-domain-containing protein [Byssothecium circinans]